MRRVVSGDILREARLRAGLSQAELARRAGKPTSVIGRWERDEVRPSLETLREVVRACGLDLTIRLAPSDREQDSGIASSLALTPSERLKQLEIAAQFVLEARRNVIRT
jgi:transcriptional regulator with XRE-family HTH domain